MNTINPFWEDVKHLFACKDPFNRDFIDAWGQRDRCCRLYSWAVADPDSIAFVAEHLGSCAIEIGAGNGYWAWQLSQCGIDIVAYDVSPPDQTPNLYFAPREEVPNPRTLAKTWYLVQQGNANKLTEQPDRTLLLCWPPYADPMAAQCLKTYQGDRFVYIGEGEGGCTGDAEFFELLEKDWEEIASHGIKQWFGLHDYIIVYQRSEEKQA